MSDENEKLNTIGEKLQRATGAAGFHLTEGSPKFLVIDGVGTTLGQVNDIIDNVLNPIRDQSGINKQSCNFTGIDVIRSGTAGVAYDEQFRDGDLTVLLNLENEDDYRKLVQTIDENTTRIQEETNKIRSSKKSATGIFPSHQTPATSTPKEIEELLKEAVISSMREIGRPLVTTFGEPHRFTERGEDRGEIYKNQVRQTIQNANAQTLVPTLIADPDLQNSYDDRINAVEKSIGRLDKGKLPTKRIERKEEKTEKAYDALFAEKAAALGVTDPEVVDALKAEYRFHQNDKEQEKNLKESGIELSPKDRKRLQAFILSLPKFAEPMRPIGLEPSPTPYEIKVRTTLQNANAEEFVPQLIADPDLQQSYAEIKKAFEHIYELNPKARSKEQEEAQEKALKAHDALFEKKAKALGVEDPEVINALKAEFRFDQNAKEREKNEQEFREKNSGHGLNGKSAKPAQSGAIKH